MPGLSLMKVVEALLAVIGGRGADGAFDLDDLGIAAHRLGQPFADALALLDEVRAGEGDVVDARLGERVIDVAVDQDDRDAGVLGVHDRRDERLLFARRQEDEIDALGDHAVDVGDLLGGRSRRVGIDELIAELLGFVLHACRLREAPRIVAFRLGEPDLVGILLSERRKTRRKGWPQAM